MGLEEVKKVMMKEKEKSLRISRIPQRIRDNFMQFANDEFEGDYGMALKFIWDKYEEFLYILNNFDVKLDYLIELQRREDKNEQSVKVRKTMTGKELKRREIKHE